ncbi:MAG: hypothetical protein K9L68_03750 [Spirochaetales bacterium]|nr:hypothetical protein [Spirochaetales bacterium]MCF7937693.1 hypothetical protein [Spirochaetales bacterium]
MKYQTADLLICPHCLPEETPLALSVSAEEVGPDGSSEIAEGTLACSRCGAVYPVTGGLGRLVPADPAVPADPVDSAGGMEPSGGANQRSARTDYEDPDLIASYLWSHYGDLAGDEEAGDAYPCWCEAMGNPAGQIIDIGAAVGRLNFEMSRTAELSVGVDLSAGLVEAARTLRRRGVIDAELVVEGHIRRTRRFLLRTEGKGNEIGKHKENAAPIRVERTDFLLADALRLPFPSSVFSAAASLNIVDKVPSPRSHLMEAGRVLAKEGARLLFSDPYSWSAAVAPADCWLGGSHADARRGSEGVCSILCSEASEEGRTFFPPMKLTAEGSAIWKIRHHENRYELIYSKYMVFDR